MLKKLVAVALMMYAAMSFAAVDVNKATAAELDAIKGIGPGISGKILDERKKGNFKDWNDFIDRVKGIGDGNAAKFSAEGLTVSGATFKGVAAAPAKKDDKAAAKDAKPAAKADDKAKVDDKAKMDSKAPAADAKAAKVEEKPKADAKAAKADDKPKADDKKAKAEEKPKADDKAKSKKDDKKVDAPKAAASAAKK